MLERKIIYYPTIIVPENWLKWAVLYFDKASSVIPKPIYETDFEDVSLDNKGSLYNMKYAIEEEVFEPTYPDILLRKFEKHKTFVKEFTEIISSKKFKRNIDPNWMDHFYRLHKHKILYGRLHNDKLVSRIYDFLLEKRLAVEIKDDNWLIVERNTFLLYMSLLAKYIADILANVSKDYAVPGTDINFQLQEELIYGISSKCSRTPVFDIRFGKILPVPKYNVPIEKVIKFREKRRDELLSFREIIDELCKKISEAESERELNLIMIQYKEKLERELNKIKSIIREANIDFVLCSFKSLLSTIGTAIGTAIINPLLLPVPIIAGFIAIAQSYSKRVRRIRSLTSSPFAYLYYGNKENILGNILL